MRVHITKELQVDIYSAAFYQEALVPLYIQHIEQSMVRHPMLPAQEEVVHKFILSNTGKAFGILHLLR